MNGNSAPENLVSSAPGNAPPDAKSHAAPIEQPWAQSVDEIVAALDVSPVAGLSHSTARERKHRYGPNRLREAKRRSALKILAAQFANIIIYVLAGAAVLAFVVGEIPEGIAVLVVLLINGGIGFFTELHAVRKMQALQQLGRVKTTVKRDGELAAVPADDLVPGDLVALDAGDMITADLRLIEANKLQINESALTGESVPVSKSTAAVAADAPLAEREGMAFKGTAITVGGGFGVVVATGMQTELGRISALVEKASDETTPLEKRLDKLGHRLIWVTVAIVAVIAVAGIFAGHSPRLIITTAIALAIATVPEGLPIVATIALARGMARMAKHNALVERLSAVETLGSTNIILTDKTGTLTENRMTVTRIYTDAGPIEVAPQAAIDVENNAALRETLRVGVLCNNAELPEDGPDSAIGDPMEVALLVAGNKAGIGRGELLEKWPERREEAFDRQVKMMATFHATDDAMFVAVKGAPEAVFEVCPRVLRGGGENETDFSGDVRGRWEAVNDGLANDGLRVLAMARKRVTSADAEPYADLTLCGLMGLVDPPRMAVRDSMQVCHRAGIRVIMATGDQATTAKNVALAVGLIENSRSHTGPATGPASSDDLGERIVHSRDLAPPEELTGAARERVLNAVIFARVSPEQKLNLIGLHQANGHVVAMIGDGVNDAPALKKANIGVAMGQRGTQVAKEAADMVLNDDNFATIEIAIREGRIIFGNIRDFVRYLMTIHVGEILAIGAATAVGAPLPVLPMQILFLNLVTDVFPALALGVGPGDENVMQRAPRDPKEPVMTRALWLTTLGHGTLLAAATLGAFAVAMLAWQWPYEQAVTVAFLTLGISQLWLVFNMRPPDSSLLKNTVTRNRWVWRALVLCIGLLALAVYLPPLSGLLDTVDPGLWGWLLIFGMSVIPLIVGQAVKPVVAKTWYSRAEQRA